MSRPRLPLDQFLLSVIGGETFAEYCSRRSIPFDGPAPDDVPSEALHAFEEAIDALPPERRADVELELSQAAELSHRDGVYHLIDACAGRNVASELLPGEAEQSLWFLVHRHEVFQEVYFHTEILGVESWRSAAAPPGIDLGDHRLRRGAFEEALRSFFRAHESNGAYSASRSYHAAATGFVVFLGRVSGHLRSLESFGVAGEHRRDRYHPARPVVFAYHPDDGTVLLRTRIGAAHKVKALMNSLASSVLGVSAPTGLVERRYDLERLRRPFDPPLPEGVSAARIKTLELTYPASEGRRRLRLETNAADRPGAIAELLDAHVGPSGPAERLRVSFAEILVTMPTRGRPRGYTIRLWPDRSNLNQSRAAQTLRRCLTLWRLTHAGRP